MHLIMNTVEQGKRLCDLCRVEMPMSATTLHPQVNGWVCVDKAACEARRMPPPHVRVATRRITDFASFHSGRRWMRVRECTRVAR